MPAAHAVGLLFGDSFVGPIHLNTIGSALVACSIHKGLFRRCASHCQNEGNLSAHMAERHSFCEQLDKLRREEPLPRRELDKLEQELHQHALHAPIPAEVA